MIDGHGQARLLDFGIASLAAIETTGDPRSIRDTRLHGARAVVGNPPTCAPTSMPWACCSSSSSPVAGRSPARNRGELIRMQLDEPPPSPLLSALARSGHRGDHSSLPRPRPRRRPPSARAVAATCRPRSAGCSARRGRHSRSRGRGRGGRRGRAESSAAWLAVSGALVALLLFALLTPQTSLGGTARKHRAPEAARRQRPDRAGGEAVGAEGE